MVATRGRRFLSTGTTTAHIVETGGSAFAVSIDVSGHHLVGDEPVAQGGGDLGRRPMTCCWLHWASARP